MSISLKSSFWRFILRRTFKNQHLPVPELRSNGIKNAKLLGGISDSVKIESIDIDGTPSEWIVPSGAYEDRVILYLHGGGYVTGSVETYRMMCSLIAENSKTKVLVPDYRLAPENPFPAALEDSVKVYSWLISRGYNPGNIIIAGDSAGGGLSIAAVLSLRNSGLPLPGAIVCLSPWTDLTLKGESHITKEKAESLLRTDLLHEWALFYTDAANLSNPLVSPAYADFKGFPPVFIQVGTDEILLDDSIQLAQKAEKDGVRVELYVWEGMWHVWQALGNLIPENRETLNQISSFISGIFEKRKQQV